MFQPRRRALFIAIITATGVLAAVVAATTATAATAAAGATTAAAGPGVPVVPVVPVATSAACPATGHITYQLSRAASPTADQTDAYGKITTAMNQATAMYNCYVGVTKALNISYVPSVSTADGNINGSIRFGAKSTMQRITAMHEIAHTLGIGTSGAWPGLLRSGIWSGVNATNQLRALTGDQAAQLHGDTQHFWPYGLNYTSEVTSDNDLVFHCKIVAALRRDLGL